MKSIKELASQAAEILSHDHCTQKRKELALKAIEKLDIGMVYESDSDKYEFYQDVEIPEQDIDSLYDSAFLAEFPEGFFYCTDTFDKGLAELADIIRQRELEESDSFDSQEKKLLEQLEEMEAVYTVSRAINTNTIYIEIELDDRELTVRFSDHNRNRDSRKPDISIVTKPMTYSDCISQDKAFDFGCLNVEQGIKAIRESLIIEELEK